MEELIKVEGRGLIRQAILYKYSKGDLTNIEIDKKREMFDVRNSKRINTQVYANRLLNYVHKVHKLKKSIFRVEYQFDSLCLELELHQKLIVSREDDIDTLVEVCNIAVKNLSKLCPTCKERLLQVADFYCCLSCGYSTEKDNLGGVSS